MPFQSAREQQQRRLPQVPGLNAPLAARLQGISITLVGDSTELNCELARQLARTLGYTPLATCAILQQLTGQSIDGLVASEGLAALGAAEVLVLEKLSTQVRACIGTCGGGGGAAARGNAWRYLFGQLTIWIDEAAQTQEDAPQREAYEQAELHIQVTRSTGSISSEQLAASILEQVQDALGKLLTKEPYLCGKKGTYMKFGCKGDWPNLEQVAEFAEQANKAKLKHK